MTLGIIMFVQLWHSFPEKLKTTKQEDYIHTCNRRPFHEEKNDTKLKSQKVQKISTTLQGKTYILLMFPIIKT